MNINLRQARIYRLQGAGRADGDTLALSYQTTIRQPSQLPGNLREERHAEEKAGGNYIDTKTFNPHLKIISMLVKQWAFMKRVPYVCMEPMQNDGLSVYGLDSLKYFARKEYIECTFFLPGKDKTLK